MSGCEGCAKRRAGEALTVRLVHEHPPVRVGALLLGAFLGWVAFRASRPDKEIPV